MINLDTLKKIIASTDFLSETSDRKKRTEYYDGVQAITKTSPWRLSGQPKTKCVTNFCKYAADQHTAFALSNKVNYSPEDNDDNAALEDFRDMYDTQMLYINDTENYRNAFVTGMGVEVVSFDGQQHVVKTYSPTEWYFLWDADENMMIAIHFALLKAGTFFNGELLTSEKTVYTVYDETDKKTYLRNGSNLQQIASEPHRMGQIPVVLYQVLPSYQPALSDSFLTQQDSYNTLVSGNIDDVLYNIDALLVLTGYQSNALTNRNVKEDGTVEPSVLDELEETQTLILDQDASANFISKGNTAEKISYQVGVTREALHMEASLVDARDVVGATGVSSGIALKLKFAPMLNAASGYTSYFERGLRKRIELINTIKTILREPIVENYKIVFTYNLPVNDLETIREAVNLKTLLDDETLLSLLSFVDDPSLVIEKRREQGADTELQSLPLDKAAKGIIAAEETQDRKETL